MRLVRKIKDWFNYKGQERKHPLQVFVDTCVFQLGFPYRPAKRVQTINWGGRDFDVELDTYDSKTLEGDFLRREAPLLRRIARAAEEGRIRLYSSELVQFELFGAPGTSSAHMEGHVFAQCVPEKVKSGFDYSLNFGLRSKPLKEQLEASFVNYPDVELHQVVASLGAKRLLDSVHLITAHRHHMNVMLTTDLKLIEAYKRCPPKLLSVLPVLPSELLHRICDRAQ